MNKEQRDYLERKLNGKIEIYKQFKMNDNSIKDQVLDIKISTLEEVIADLIKEKGEKTC